jgi:hypothetical protein
MPAKNTKIRKSLIFKETALAARYNFYSGGRGACPGADARQARERRFAHCADRVS